MRSLLIRFITNVVAIVLVTRGIPLLFPTIVPPIGINDWGTLLVFAGFLALANSFVKPILKVLSFPITCLTAGLFSIVINLAMFFLAAWLTSMFSGQVEVGWLGALIGAVAVAVVGAVMSMILPDDDR